MIKDSRLTSTFSHLRWGWKGDDCPPHLLILRHMLLHSQQVHILHQTTFSLQCSPNKFISSIKLPFLSSAHPTHPLCPFYMSKQCQSSLPQLHNRKVFNSTHLFHVTARPPFSTTSWVFTDLLLNSPKCSPVFTRLSPMKAWKTFFIS